MTAVDRPDNGQDVVPPEVRPHRDAATARGVAAYESWLAAHRDELDNGQDEGPRVLRMDAVAGGAWTADNLDAPLASGRARAGEQQRERAAKLHSLLSEWEDGERTYIAVAEDMVDEVRELLALLGGPQPDGDAEYATARHAFGSPEYLAELDKLSAPPCPVYSHGTDGWHCAVTGDHDQHTNAAGDETW